MIRDNHYSEISEERISKWQLSRGDFFKSLLALGLSTQLIGCSSDLKDESDINSSIRITPIMTNQQANIIKVVQSILFPNDGNGPSVEEINAFPYLLWFLQDDLIEKVERDYFTRGADWANQEAIEFFNIPFLELSENLQVEMVEFLAKKKRTKLWLSKLLTGIFEALISDPVYGGNTNEVGWKWLNHNPGSPRSKDGYEYPNVIKSVRNEV